VIAADLVPHETFEEVASRKSGEVLLLRTIYQVYHDKRRNPAKGTARALRRLYRRVVPGKVRQWRGNAWMFVFGRYLHELAERRPQRDFFRRAFTLLTLNGISGDYLEFGVGSGVSFGYAYRYAFRAGHSAHLWAFDSFEGLPSSDDPRDSHPLWQAGNFAAPLERFLDSCATDGIPRSRFEIVKGFYSETL